MTSSPRSCSRQCPVYIVPRPSRAIGRNHPDVASASHPRATMALQTGTAPTVRRGSPRCGPRPRSSAVPASSGPGRPASSGLGRPSPASSGLGRPGGGEVPASPERGADLPGEGCRRGSPERGPSPYMYPSASIATVPSSMT